MTTMLSSELGRIRRSRRAPRLTQFDYLHIRRLVDDLTSVLATHAPPGARVLDVWSGSRPYDDLLPPTAEIVSLDVEGNPYGVADVVSNDFLPFPDASFDVVMFIQGFHFVPDPVAAVAELDRVLRPGGTVVVSIPFVWEYAREGFDRRYTGPQLAALFAGWQAVDVIENGGRAVAWATVTATLARPLDRRVHGRAPWLARPAFGAFYAVVNSLGLAFDVAERRFADGSRALPMNLLLTARRRSDQ